MRPGKVSNFQQFRSALSSLLGLDLRALPRLIVLCGTTDYILQYTLNALKDRWLTLSGRAAQVVRVDAGLEESIYALAEQRQLFTPANLYTLQGSLTSTALAKALKVLKAAPNLANWLCFAIRTEGEAAALKKATESLKGVLLSCVEPRFRDTEVFIQDLCNVASLRLDRSAQRAILELFGGDLWQVENAIRTLSLIHAEHLEAVYTQEQVLPYIGGVRVDQSFHLDDLLLGKRFDEAKAFLLSLLARGDSPLAVLGLLVRHVRHALRFASPSGAPPLPGFVADRYRLYVRGHGVPKYAAVLRLCQKSDVNLKSSKLDSGLVLTSIVDSLA